ncbi:helix-turn-helix domain-containing protein [Salmonella enterica]|nr:helix-turn-helix domain-containing protein [Salmonella enterica]
MKLINNASKINAKREHYEDACTVIHSCIESSLFLLAEEEGDYSHSITQLLLVAQKKANSICAPTNYLYQSLSLPETIGARIRSARKHARHTQAFVAAAVGVTAAAVAQWESGATEPSWKYILPMANALHCDLLWLLGDDESNELTGITDGIDGNLILGDRIQLARENLGLSEADLARQLGTYSDHISDWECGITEPPASMVIPLANALKCDPLWLLGDSESNAPVKVMQNVDVSTIGKRIGVARVNQRMYTEELENAIHAPEGSVFRWETGKAIPSSQYIDILARVLNVSVTWLLTGKEIAKES